MINTVYFVGSLISDPEFDSFEERSFVIFYLNANYKGTNEYQERIEVWAAGSAEEMARGLKKGQHVFVIGGLQNLYNDEGSDDIEKIIIDADQIFPVEIQPDQQPEKRKKRAK